MADWSLDQIKKVVDSSDLMPGLGTGVGGLTTLLTGVSDKLTKGGGVDYFLKIFAEVFKTLAKDEAFLTAILDALKEVLPKIRDAFKKFLDELLKLLEKVIPELYETISHLGRELLSALDNALPNPGKATDNKESFETILKPLAEALGFFLKIVAKIAQETTGNAQIRDALLKVLHLALQRFSSIAREYLKKNIPKPLAPALATFYATQTIFKVLKELGQLQGIIDRAEAVQESLNDALDVLEVPKDGPAGVWLRSKTGDEGILQKALDHLNSDKDPLDLLLDMIITGILPFKLLEEALKGCISSSSYKFWDALPAGPKPGALNRWLNELEGDKPSLAPLKRRFKVRMIGEYDAYVMGRIEQYGKSRQLSDSDRTEGAQILADLIAIFFKTIILFVFEPECFRLHAPKAGVFGDIQLEFGRFVGRQIALPVKAAISTTLRGIWIWSVENDNLIEAIASLFASIFGALVEAIGNNLAWTFEISCAYPLTAYPDNGGAEDDERKAWNGIQLFPILIWPSSERTGRRRNNQGNNHRLIYLAFIRGGWGAKTLADQLRGLIGDDGGKPYQGALAGLIRDLGAYIDVASQRYLIDGRHDEDTLGERIFVTEAVCVKTGKDSSLRVRATSSRWRERPAPILRLYGGCQSVVLVPPNGSFGSDYEAVIDYNPFEDCPKELTLISNRGGIAKVATTRSSFGTRKELDKS